jgi:type VI secretion system protein ImpF
MAESTARIRLLPSLLDRLTDDEPMLVEESRRLERQLDAHVDAEQRAALGEVLERERPALLTARTAADAGLGALGPEALAAANAMIALEQRRRFERRAERSFSIDRMRDAVLRDLDWLLNTENLASLDVDDRDDEVADSVLNYGVAPLMGRTLAELRAGGGDAVAREIKKAIRRFEPRLSADRLTVRAVDDESGDPRSVRLQIEAELLVEPAPVRLVVDTVLDAEDGHFRLEPGW